MKWSQIGSVLFLTLEFAQGGSSLAAEERVGAIYKCEATEAQARRNYLYRIGAYLNPMKTEFTANISVPISLVKGKNGAIKASNVSFRDLSLEDMAKVQEVQKRAQSSRSQCRQARFNPVLLYNHIVTVWCSISCTVEPG